MQSLHLVIVSGLSGSGKTHAIKCFEDLGFFCVDNLPPALFSKFVELCAQRGADVKSVALGMDVREREFFSDFWASLEDVKLRGHTVELLFFESKEEVLVRRFSESRRPHPLLPHAPVLEGIRLERERLLDLRRRADRIIDTSDLTIHELRDLLVRQYRKPGQGHDLSISLLTFGFKYGVPYDMDMLFDLRFLRNPNFVADLKPLTGEDPRVQSFVLNDPDAQSFLEQIEALCAFLIPRFERERRSYLTVALGCTGGRHRSVAFACHLRERFASMGHEVTLRHRDLQQP